MTGALTPVPNNNPASQGQESGPSTGVKMFLILTLALLPLGLIALFASLQASRTADLAKAALLNVADRTSVVKGKGVSVRGGFGGGRVIKKQNTTQQS